MIDVIHVADALQLTGGNARENLDSVSTVHLAIM
jgi:hypothetical protein